VSSSPPPFPKDGRAFFSFQASPFFVPVIFHRPRRGHGSFVKAGPNLLFSFFFLEGPPLLTWGDFSGSPLFSLPCRAFWAAAIESPSPLLSVSRKRNLFPPLCPAFVHGPSVNARTSFFKSFTLSLPSRPLPPTISQFYFFFFSLFRFFAHHPNLSPPVLSRPFSRLFFAARLAVLSSPTLSRPDINRALRLLPPESMRLIPSHRDFASTRRSFLFPALFFYP